jgi:mono/diheme cytochrome c family protein
MTRIRITAALALGLTLAGTAALAQQTTDLGKREYDSNCASCHGADGKGAGPFVEFLKRSPPDLTTLARRNGGVFPVARAYEVIEGAGPGHGTRDMPIWGRDYRVQAGEYYVDVPYDPAVYARTRMLALVDYLARMQGK